MRRLLTVLPIALLVGALAAQPCAAGSVSPTTNPATQAQIAAQQRAAALAAQEAAMAAQAARAAALTKEGAQGHNSHSANHGNHIIKSNHQNEGVTHGLAAQRQP